MARPRKLKLVQINFRAFADDIAKVQDLANAERIPWNVKLRLVIHDALEKKTRKGGVS